MLFGVLGCAAAPLYLAAAASTPAGSGSYQTTGTGPLLLSGMPMGTKGFYIGWYWTVALVAGYLLTVWWYWRAARRPGTHSVPRLPDHRRRADRAGRGSSPLSKAVPGLFLVWAPIGDVWIRGTLAFLIIAVGLWVLARAEHSPGLAVITLAYTATAVLASLYNVENILFRLGWNPAASPFGWNWTVLPGILLPALVLLASGSAPSWFSGCAGRRDRRRGGDAGRRAGRARPAASDQRPR